MMDKNDPATPGYTKFGSTDSATMVTIEYVGQAGDLPYRGAVTGKLYYFGTPYHVRAVIARGDAEALALSFPTRFRIVKQAEPAPQPGAPAPRPADAPKAAPLIAPAANPYTANLAKVMQANGVVQLPDGTFAETEAKEPPAPVLPVDMVEELAAIFPAGSDKYPQAKAIENPPYRPPEDVPSDGDPLPDIAAMPLTEIKTLKLDARTAETLLAEELQGKNRKGVLAWLQQIVDA